MHASPQRSIPRYRQLLTSTDDCLKIGMSVVAWFAPRDMPKTNPRSRFVTRQQAAWILNVSVRTVDRLAVSGRLKAKRSSVGFGRGGLRIFFERVDVEKLARGSIRPDVVRSAN